MNLFIDSFSRALAYCLRPRVLALTFLPLLAMLLLWAVLAYQFWDPAVLAVQSWLDDQAHVRTLSHWFVEVGAGNPTHLVAPVLVLLVALPAIGIATLLMVSWFMTSVLVALVAERRFPQLARRRGGRLWRSALLSAGASAMALLALAISMPLWLIPPLVLVLPPLIWGWLTYRVMHYDVLAEHASHEERIEIARRHRIGLFGIGVATAYLGAAPGMVWALGAMAIVFAPLLVPLAIWIYTCVFAFSALWFAHYCLSALAALRDEPLSAGASAAAQPHAVLGSSAGGSGHGD